MEVVRSVLGMPHPRRPPEYARVERRLHDQMTRLRALDAKVDADFPPSNGKMLKRRRAGDR